MELTNLLSAVKQVVQSTGAFILENRNKVKSADVEIKSLNSLVSYVDKKAEEQLVHGLQRILPEAGFITEEDTEDDTTQEYTWIIDPLDGTTNFLFGLPIFAISVALQHKNEMVLGVVYELGQKELFTAIKGGGAFLNNQPIKVSQNTAFADSLIATGFPYYDFKHTDAYLNLLKSMFGKCRGLRRLGSAATDLAYVACGRFDAYFEYSLHAWDVAAGILLVTEAGGKVSDFKDDDDYLFGGEIVAASSALKGEVTKMVMAHLKG